MLNYVFRNITKLYTDKVFILFMILIATILSYKTITNILAILLTSQNSNIFFSSMPKSRTLGPFVESATKCLATAVSCNRVYLEFH